MLEILQSRYTIVAPEADRRLPSMLHSVCAKRLLYFSRCSVLWQWKLKGYVTTEVDQIYM